MAKFLDLYELPKLNQDDFNNENRSFASNETVAGLKKQTLTKKNKSTDGFAAETNQTFKRSTNISKYQYLSNYFIT